MIGIYFKQRRREFLEFASQNPIDFEEILDPTDRNSLALYSEIFTDDSALSAESFAVKDVSSEDFSEVFKPYIKTHKIDNVYSEERFYSAIFYYFDRVFNGCAQVFIPPIVEQATEVPEIKLPVYSIQRDSMATESVPGFDYDATQAPIDLQPVNQSISQSVEAQPTEIFIEEGPSVQQIPQYQAPIQQRPQYQQQVYPEHEQIAYTNGFTFVDEQMPMQRPSNDRVTYSSNVHVRRKGTSQRRTLVAPINIFSSLTDKAGTTTVAFLLAKAMASQNPDLRILYLDLNISNPNTVNNIMGLSASDSASITSIVTATEIDFASNLSLLTTTVSADGGSFYMITFGEASFKQKATFATIDYTQFLDILVDNFDIVFVDIGKLQGTLPYQQILMQKSNAKHILVADGSSQRALNSFVTASRGLMFGFEVVVNKSVPTVGTFILNKSMHMDPLAVVRQHNNTMRFIADTMQFEGTALQKELRVLGGVL